MSSFTAFSTEVGKTVANSGSGLPKRSCKYVSLVLYGLLQMRITSQGTWLLAILGFLGSCRTAGGGVGVVRTKRHIPDCGAGGVRLFSGGRSSAPSNSIWGREAHFCSGRPLSIPLLVHLLDRLGKLLLQVGTHLFWLLIYEHFLVRWAWSKQTRQWIAWFMAVVKDRSVGNCSDAATNHSEIVSVCRRFGLHFWCSRPGSQSFRRTQSP